MPEAGSHPSVFLPSLRHFFNNGTRISASRLAAELRRGRVEKRERKEGRMWGDRISVAGERGIVKPVEKAVWSGGIVT